MNKIVTKFKLQVIEYDATGYYIKRYYTEVDVIAETLEEAKEKALERTPKKEWHPDWKQTVKVMSSEDIVMEVSE